ncbi:ABC transporter permease subunit [Spirillospora sp. CA-128828]|uniref:ABC transporter permease subunit n=1 Tax=Spirillospora sp. CA-128828 TaxID=3240033 RepID=UPI003D929E51
MPSRESSGSRGRAFALPLTIWVLTSFFAAMPWELEKAAQADGASPSQAFLRVLVPLAAPGLFTTAIMVFLSAWDEYLLAGLLSNGNPDVARRSPWRSPTSPAPSRTRSPTRRSWQPGRS